MREAHDPVPVAGAIYGGIVAMSTVAPLTEGEQLGAGRLLLGVVGTMLVFWLAHAFAETAARRAARAEPLR